MAEYIEVAWYRTLMYVWIHEDTSEVGIVNSILL